MTERIRATHFEAHGGVDEDDHAACEIHMGADDGTLMVLEVPPDDVRVLALSLLRCAESAELGEAVHRVIANEAEAKALHAVIMDAFDRNEQL